MRRFFVDIDNKRNGSVVIDGDEASHINRVLRLKAGDKIIVCFGDGYDHTAEILELSNKHCKAKLLGRKKNEKENSIHIILFAPLIKSDKLEYVAQKATELGVNKIVPFVSKYSTIKLGGSSNKVDRLARIALEASKQCGRAVVPQVDTPIIYADVLVRLANYDLSLVGYELETDKTLKQVVSEVASEVVSKLAVMDKGFADKAKSIAIVIGSEGGFSESEIESAKSVGAFTFSLGRRILRSETACIVSVANLLQLLGEI
ncbi:MAG: 16S rRNA (uracil(1498)-N(3))-methyltransferase [Firmicutes bacterium]|nr:16S rRNA (uracil(1498)-N(3))-methyltransferase [Bacillota bacterium]